MARVLAAIFTCRALICVRYSPRRSQRAAWVGFGLGLGLGLGLG